ncbi:hypothetical protein KH172YL63_30790 [Bacillus sp. KH172YL63]|nr:hypothetical protein KH172YL63_30790 [Bacillus sp. KH172YL63]
MLDSCGKRWTGETPQAQPRRLTASPAESEHLERKSTAPNLSKSNNVYENSLWERKERLFVFYPLDFNILQ